MADFEVLPLAGQHSKSDSGSHPAVLKIPAPLACYWLSQSEHGEAEKQNRAAIKFHLSSTTNTSPGRRAQCTFSSPVVGGPIDVATAYFAISGYRLVKERLTNGRNAAVDRRRSEDGRGRGVRPNRRQEYLKLLKGDVEAEPFSETTLRLVEELIAFLRSEKVQVRLYDQGFLHAKAYLFHHDRIGPQNRGDRMRPYAAIVGSSNFTGPGLSSNSELNLVHRVLTADDVAVDREAAECIGYLREEDRVQPETLLDPSGIDVPETGATLYQK